MENIPLKKDIHIAIWIIAFNIVLSGLYFSFTALELYLKSTTLAVLHTVLALMKLGIFIYIVQFLKRFLVRLYDYHRAGTLLSYLIVLNILISYFTIRTILTSSFSGTLYPVIIVINIMWGLSIMLLGIHFLRIPEPLKKLRIFFAINMIAAGILYASHYLVMLSIIPAILADITLLCLLCQICRRLSNSSVPG